MNDVPLLEAVRRIKKLHGNLTVGLGIAIGLILTIYFFSFAMLVDRAPPILWKIQALSALGLVLMLVYLKQCAFFGVRLWLRARPPYREILKGLRPADMDQNEEQLIARLQPILRSEPNPSQRVP